MYDICLYIHFTIILDTSCWINSHMFFFFEVPRKFQSPQRIASLGGFLAGESSKYFRARKVTLGHVEEVIEGNPTLWLCLKVTPYRGWYMGTGLAEKPWKSWKVEVKKHRPQWMNSCLVLYGWHAENDGRHVRVGNLAHLWEGCLWNRQLHPFQHSTWVWEVFKMPVQTGIHEGLKKISIKVAPRLLRSILFSCTYGFFGTSAKWWFICTQTYTNIIPQNWLTWGCLQVFIAMPRFIFHYIQ